MKMAAKATVQELMAYEVPMSREEHAVFLLELTKLLDEHDVFNNWFFVHIVGSPCPPHSPFRPWEAIDAWSCVEKLVTVEEGERKNWRAMIGFELSSDNDIVLIRESSRIDLLTTILPKASAQSVQHRLEHSNAIIPCYNYNNASLLQVSTAGLQRNDGVEYIHVQPRYVRPLSVDTTPFQPSDLYPTRMPKTLRRMARLIALIKKELTNPEEQNVIWTHIEMMTTYDAGKTTGRMTLNQCVDVIDSQSWWYVTNLKR